MKQIILFLLFVGFNIQAQPQIGVEEVAEWAGQVVDIRNAGDERMFIVDREGRIFIMDENDEVNLTPYLDIRNRVHSTGGEDERGMLGLTFHPNYQNNGLFYVNYIANGNPGNTIVSQFSVTADGNIADEDSEIIIIEITQPYWNHNGGCIAFGPDDGYLYIGMGDGGSANDPQNNAQNLSSPLGKMLRLDIDNQENENNYAIPMDNPFYGNEDVLQEIWSYGWRNPWRFSFDSQTADMWVGDVGQGEWEEVDMELASNAGGDNYGWRCWEGNEAFNQSSCTDEGELVFPVFEYNHNNQGGLSISGGYVYRGEAMPGLAGYYYCADFVSGHWWSINTGTFEVEQYSDFLGEVTTFGISADGNRFYAGVLGGEVYRITDLCEGAIAVEPVVQDASCAVSNDGSISLDIEAMSTVSEITWSTGESGVESIENLANGDYSVFIIDNEGCSVALDIIVAIAALNEPSISFADGFLIASEIENVESYQWYLDDEILTDETSISVTPEDSGNYSVEVFYTNGCMETSMEFTYVTNSVNELENILIISNTANGFVFQSTDENIHSIQVLSLEGRVMIDTSIGAYNTFIETERLHHGLYVVCAFSNQNEIIATSKYCKL